MRRGRPIRMKDQTRDSAWHRRCGGAEAKSAMNPESGFRGGSRHQGGPATLRATRMTMGIVVIKRRKKSRPLYEEEGE